MCWNKGRKNKTKNTMNTKIDLNPKLVALIFSVLVLLFAIAFYIIIAWTEPTATPPGANVPTPINIGTTTQHKNGEIGATIFRDRDNTAWFVDPAGVSVLAGNVGIGTTTPAHRLDVVGNVMANAYFHRSDRELKTGIKPLENSLEKILDISGVSFNWKEGEEVGIGFIAQEIEQKFPELVITNKQTGQKGVNYSGFIAVLIQALQQQQKQIEHQQIKIDELKTRVEELQKR
jgi:hypothetical protein